MKGEVKGALVPLTLEMLDNLGHGITDLNKAIALNNEQRREDAINQQISGITKALENVLKNAFEDSNTNIPIELNDYMVELTIQNPKGSLLYSGHKPTQSVQDTLNGVSQYLVTLKLKDRGQNTFAQKLETLEEIANNNKEDSFFVPINPEKRKLIISKFKERYGMGAQLDILNTYLEQPFFQQGMVKENGKFETKYNFIIRPNQSIAEIEHSKESVYDFTRKLREVKINLEFCPESTYMIDKMISALEDKNTQNYSFKSQKDAAEFLERNEAIKKEDSKHIDIYVNGEVVLQFYGPKEKIMGTIEKFDELLSLASLKTMQEKGYITPVELE